MQCQSHSIFSHKEFKTSFVYENLGDDFIKKKLIKESKGLSGIYTHYLERKRPEYYRILFLRPKSSSSPKKQTV